MPQPPVPVDWPARYVPAAGDFNTNITQAFGFLQSPPVFRAIQLTVQSVPGSTWTPVTLDTVLEDTYSGWNATSNHYVAQCAGQYELTWAAQLNGGAGAAGATGYYLSANGVTTGPWEWGRAEAGHAPFAWQGYGLVYMSAGDWVQPLVWHNNSSAVNTNVGSGTAAAWMSSGLEIAWISE